MLLLLVVVNKTLPQRLAYVIGLIILLLPTFPILVESIKQWKPFDWFSGLELTPAHTHGHSVKVAATGVRCRFEFGNCNIILIICLECAVSIPLGLIYLGLKLRRLAQSNWWPKNTSCALRPPKPPPWHIYLTFSISFPLNEHILYSRFARANKLVVGRICFKKLNFALLAWFLYFFCLLFYLYIVSNYDYIRI